MKVHALLALAASSLATTAAPLTTAEISKTINDVRVLQPSKPATTAVVGSKIGGSSSVQTGRQSRAELTFADRTVTRIGANSLFSFRSGSRDMEIKDGSFLLQVPKNAGGATIRTSTVTAAITGTTTMMEHSAGKYVKFITLEGKATLSLKNGKSTKVIPPGSMVVFHPDVNQIPDPVVVNMRKLIRTSNLVNMGPLLEAEPLIKETVVEQDAKRQNGDLNPSGTIVEGPGSSTGKDSSDPGTIRNNLPTQPPPPPKPDYPGGGGPIGPPIIGK